MYSNSSPLTKLFNLFSIFVIIYSLFVSGVFVVNEILYQNGIQNELFEMIFHAYDYYSVLIPYIFYIQIGLAIIGIILIHCKVQLPTSCVISWFISTACYFGMWIAMIWAVGKALEPF